MGGIVYSIENVFRRASSVAKYPLTTTPGTVNGTWGGPQRSEDSPVDRAAMMAQGPLSDNKCPPLSVSPLQNLTALSMFGKAILSNLVVAGVAIPSHHGHGPGFDGSTTGCHPTSPIFTANARMRIVSSGIVYAHAA